MIKLRLFFYLFTIILSHTFAYSQGQFQFDSKGKRAETINFKSINNLIILKAKLNGEPINFLLDTGVNKTKVFGQVKDSTRLEDAEFISLRSLGSPDPVKAYMTLNNSIDFGPITGENQEVYYITDTRFDLASKLGVNVQGIIGYEFLKDFIFRLNYSKKHLRIYQHDKFNRKLRGFDKIDFRLIRKKPHIKLTTKFLNSTSKDLIFLLDTGSGDAFWVFEDRGIKAPENSFADFVGYGLESAIQGRRSKMESVQIGDYELNEPRVAYIDSTSVKLFTADRFKNGIVGAEVLRKFVIFLDYKNQKLYLRAGSYFDDTSNYDRSGLLLTYVGEEIRTIKSPVKVTVNEGNSYQKRDEESYFEIRLQISRTLQVTKIRQKSPAAAVDIQIGDRILKINGKSVDKINLEDITKLLSSEEGKKIKIQLQRDNIILTRAFYLRSQLNLEDMN
jgi:hypothetical protein